MSSRSAGSASVIVKPLPFNTSGRGRLSSPAVRKPYRLSYNFVQQCCAGRSHISGHIQSIALSHTTLYLPEFSVWVVVAYKAEWVVYKS